jgi:uncharacterized protein (TIGR03435 family)
MARWMRRTGTCARKTAWAIAIGPACVSVIAALAFGQNPRTAPSFQIADVHVSPRVSDSLRIQNLQGGVFRAGRYEIHNAAMLDLIKIAYGVDPDLVVGGPAWLEFDHFDVIAKAPTATSPETIKMMLQALLADRFQLVVHKDTKPIQGFVLSVGKDKPKLKPAGGSGEPGCHLPQPPPPRSPGSIPVNVVSCSNVTMEEFAPMLRQMVQEFGPTLGQTDSYLNGPVLNSTVLKGAWDFELKWTDKRLLTAAGADGISIFDALDKQLGLKLEAGKVPMPVLVVDGANEKPTANSPEVTTALPPPAQVEFEVASVRPSKPGTDEDVGEFLPGGRYEAHAVPLFFMLTQAWDYRVPGDITGLPKWLTRDSPRFDIVAKAPAAAIAVGEGHEVYDLQSMMRALLVDRFKMKAHYEDRPMDAYTLVADKPKLKRADLSNRTANRTACKTARAPRNPDAGPPPMIATCQNITMAQFAEQLQTIAPVYLYYPVLDASGIEGSWDLSLSFSPAPPNLAGGGGNGGGKGGGKGGGPAAGASSDPSGAVSLFDALEKQLGLKLEKHQRPEPVLVIDHIEEKPTDN